MNLIIYSMFSHKKVTQQALIRMKCDLVSGSMTCVNFMQNTHQLPAYWVQGHLCPMDKFTFILEICTIKV